MKSEISIAFRRVLARELPHWHDDGLIDEHTSAELVRRYTLDALGDSVKFARRRASAPRAARLQAGRGRRPADPSRSVRQALVR
jgi:hypothetical protein